MSNSSSTSNLKAARAALVNGKLDQAVYHAKRHLLESPDDPSGLRLLFESYQQLGRPDDAALAGRRLVKAAPTDFDARLQTARIELSLGRPQKVIELLAENTGEDRSATALLAAAYERAGKATLAATLRDSITRAQWLGEQARDSDFKRLYFARQLCGLLMDHTKPCPERDGLIETLEEGRYAEARPLLQSWSQTVSDDVRRLVLADWYLLTGQLRRARLPIEEGVDEPELAGPWQNRMGDLAQLDGDYEKARTHYRKATVVELADTNAWLDLARTEFLRGDRGAAIAACEKVLNQEAPEADRWLAQEFLEELRSDALAGALPPGFYGLVWWERGGGLFEVEVAERTEAPGLVVTGNVGRSLEDAARVAYQFAQGAFDHFNEVGAHVHFPEFRSPKDGGSAGLLLAVLLYGLATAHRPHDRVAVTGEISLQGKVRPVGGLREKVTAAHLHAVDRVILPAQNTSDLVKVPLAAKRSLEFSRVRHFDEVIESLGW